MMNSQPSLPDPEGDEEAMWSELDDYLDQLSDYEERLVRGEIRCQ